MLGVNRSSHLSAVGDTNPLNQEFGFKLLVKNQRHSDFLSRATSLPRLAASFVTESRYTHTEKSEGPPIQDRSVQLTFILDSSGIFGPPAPRCVITKHY
jgi:hypothetical protein